MSDITLRTHDHRQFDADFTRDVSAESSGRGGEVILHHG